MTAAASPAPALAPTTASAVARRPAVAAFLARTHQHWIGGAWRPASGGGCIDVHDPGTGSVLTRIARGTAADIEAGVTAAEQAFRHAGWASLPPSERAQRLTTLATLIESHLEDLACLESLDVGKPIAQARAFDVPHAAATFRYYAGLVASRPARERLSVASHDAERIATPYGVCGFIIPWNFPFLLIGWDLAPALAAGNTVVVKPAEDTSLTTLFFAELAQQAGIPAGVINVVTGTGEEAGAALARHPRLKHLAFTGSPEVGRLVGRACGENLVPAKLELGGKGAAVILPDADPRATAQALCAALTLNAGQVCCTATRWIVHHRIRDAFLAAAVETLSAMRLGHGSDPTTTIGPVVNAVQHERIRSLLARGVASGARALLASGTATVPGCPGGHYLRPGLYATDPDNILATTEVFGPIAAVMAFETDDEAVALVNRSDYGLANSVWSADPDHARRIGERLIAGNTWINAHNVFPHGVPYGGCNRSGCGGGVLGPDTLAHYLRHQSVVRPLA